MKIRLKMKKILTHNLLRFFAPECNIPRTLLECIFLGSLESSVIFSLNVIPARYDRLVQDATIPWNRFLYKCYADFFWVCIIFQNICNFSKRITDGCELEFI